MDKLEVMLPFGRTSKGQIQPCPPVCSLRGYLHPHASTSVSWLIPPEMLAQVSLQRSRVKMTVWLPLGHSASPSCPVPWFACLPTGLNHSSCACHCPGARLQDFLGGLRGIKIVISHNLGKLLIRKFFPCLGSTWLHKPCAPRLIPGIWFLLLIPYFPEAWANGRTCFLKK